MQFAHGFHAQPVEQENASTRWRVDPRFVGPSYVLGDLASAIICRACRISWWPA